VFQEQTNENKQERFRKQSDYFIKEFREFSNALDMFRISTKYLNNEAGLEILSDLSTNLNTAIRFFQKHSATKSIEKN